MKDQIERQDAIERITKQYQDSDGGRDRYAVGINVGLTKALNALKDVPSADPERKTGHWVYNDHARDWGLGAWCCSECGAENDSLPYHKCRDPYSYAGAQYCGCCGAKMVKKND